MGKAAEEGAPNLSAGEQKKLDEILSKDPSKLTVGAIKDLEDMTSKLANENADLRKPLDSDDNKRLSELLSKAPGDLDEKEIGELEELTSRLAKENDDLKKAAEEGAPNLSAGEQKKLDEILSKDPSKLT